MSSWDKLKLLTPARVGLGRIGSSLPTHRVLEFQRAHAAARSAVWLAWDHQHLQNEFQKIGERPQLLASNVSDRETYLRFPSHGRQLSDASKEILKTQKAEFAFIVSDGLSALAVQNHMIPLWKELAPQLQKTFPELTYKIIFVPFGRVAISDPIGELLGAKISVIFIGERPGLNSPDSLGIYLTFNPASGNSDAHRNCISNVRTPNGLSYPHASLKLLYLMNESLRRQLSGVNLKDDLVLNAIPTKSLND
jgi:ethanolamine ammonia-lyase small subunit